MLEPSATCGRSWRAEALRLDEYAGWVLDVDLDAVPRPSSSRAATRELAGLPVIVGGSGDLNEAAKGGHVRVV